MAERLVLGIDLGSSSAKAVLAAESGRIIARAAVPQRVDRPAPGLAEQEPSSWWAALRSLVAATWATVPPRARTSGLAGIAISAHFPTLVLSDEAGTPLTPAMLYEDRRADAWVGRASELAGSPLDGDELLPKLLWLAAERRDILAGAHRIFNPQGWLVFRLTGVHVTDHRTALRSGLFDAVGLVRRAGLGERLGLDPHSFPAVRSAAEIAGQVGAEPAAGLGIPTGTPVLVGLPDTPATLLGAGVVRAGDVLLYYGTTATADVCTQDLGDYLRDPTTIHDWAPYREIAFTVLGPALSWAAAGLTSRGSANAGAVLGSDVGVSDTEPAMELVRLDEEAAALGPGPDAPYVIPQFLAHSRAGEPADRPAIVGLDVVHGRADLHRALLESFGFTVRAGLEASGLERVARRYVAAGGGARSATWRQIVSDVLGVEQSWPPRSDGALGSAMLAALVTCGRDVLGSDLGAWLGRPHSTHPDLRVHELETARYGTWLRMRHALGHIWRSARTDG